MIDKQRSKVSVLFCYYNPLNSTQNYTFFQKAGSFNF